MAQRSLGLLAAGLAAAGLTAAAASPASAQALARTEWGTVTQIEAGWSVNAMAVYHTAPMVNPGGCAVTNAGYATSPDDSGNNLFHTLILSALLNHKEVVFLISGCVFDKPHIISVTMH